MSEMNTARVREIENWLSSSQDAFLPVLEGLELIDALKEAVEMVEECEREIVLLGSLSTTDQTKEEAREFLKRYEGLTG